MKKGHLGLIITIAAIICFVAFISFGNEMVSTYFFGIDTDGDSYNDDVDAFPNDPTEWLDSDNDTYGDNSDTFPNNPSEHLDSDGDGYGDNSDAFPKDDSEHLDSDGDGYGDNIDAFPKDDSEHLDSDGDGYGDNIDAFPKDDSEWLDADNDGYGDNSDDFPNDANFHERIEIKSGTCYLHGELHWERHGNRAGWGHYEYDCILGDEGFYVDSDTKYVICEMSVQKIQNGQPGQYVFYYKTIETEHTSYTESIGFFANDPSTALQEKYEYTLGNDIRLPITDYNWGKWSGIAFYYESIDYDALVTFDLYMIK